MVYKQASIGLALALGMAVTLGTAPQPRVAAGSASSAVRTLHVPATFPSAVAIDARTRRVFVANTKDAISVLNADTGRLIRTTAVAPQRDVFKTGWYAFLAVDEPGGRVFIVNRGENRVIILDARTGRLLRTVQVGPPTRIADVLNVAVAPSIGHVFVTAQPLPRYRWAAYPGTVSMLDARSGRTLRTVPSLANPDALAVDARTNHVFVDLTASDSKMLDARSGRVVRTLAHRIWLGGTLGMVVDERTQRVFAADQFQPIVMQADTRSGHVFRPIALRAVASAVAVDGRSGRVFIATRDDGRLHVVDERTDRELRTIRIGQLPVVMAFDARSNHVFVVNRGDSTVSLLDETRL